MRYLVLVFVFLSVGLARADDEELPWTLGLDWSSDGRYIAVATSHGVHIRHSGDLSLHSVLGDKCILTAVWSNHGLNLAYSKGGDHRIILHNLESGDDSYLNFPSLYNPSGSIEASTPAQSIVWSPSDEFISAGRRQQIAVWTVESQEIRSDIRFWNLYPVDLAQVDWRPHGRQILSFSGNGLAIWDYYSGLLIDFIWNREGVSWPARWSPDGSMIAAGRGPVSVWKVNTSVPDDSWAEIGGERIQTLDLESARLFGLTWHPDSTKLAFIVNHYFENGLDFSRSGAVIWDLSADAVTVLPDVFNLRRSPVFKGIEWSPDGSRLAAMSSDGRVVIWETENYEVIAEYGGYRSLLDT